MDDLIRALQIFLKYKNEEYPTCCGHDTLYVVGVSFSEVSAEDVLALEALGFNWAEDTGAWYSDRFGSA